MLKISTVKLAAAQVNAEIDTSEQLAQRAGISVNTVSRLRNGGCAKIPTIRKIATALGVDPADILKEKEA